MTPDDPLVYSNDPQAIVDTIRRAKGWKDQKIMHELIAGCAQHERRALAENFAPVFGLTPAQMLKRALGND